MRAMAPMVCVTVALALLAPGGADACSCADPLPLDEAFELAEAVFEGVVIEAEPDSNPSLGTFLTFDVENAWKGTSSGDTLEVYGALLGGTCGRSILLGERWILLAYARDGADPPLGVGPCGPKLPADSTFADRYRNDLDDVVAGVYGDDEGCTCSTEDSASSAVPALALLLLLRSRRSQEANP